MSSLFYESIIEYKRIDDATNRLDPAQKEEAISLIEEALTLRLLDEILDRLPEENQEALLDLMLEENSQESVLPFLETQIADAKNLIYQKANEILDDLLCDL